MKQLRDSLARAFPALPLLSDEPLARHTSFGIGGPASLMALPRDEGELCGLLALCGDVPVLLMGNGTNLLISDRGFAGVAVKTEGLSSVEQTGETTLRAGAGLLLSRLAVFAQKQGLAGLSFAHGIPGTVGGAVCMNAGAYGGEMAQVTKRTALCAPSGETIVLQGDEHDFSYRKSYFTAHPGAVALWTEFSLSPGDPAVIRAEMDDLAARRRGSQPLDKPSAGSVFKRPPGYFAGTLIQQCGLKGRAVGGAQVSEKHAGFIINRGGATCADVLRLIEEIQKEVLSQTGVRLEPELKIVGESL